MSITQQLIPIYNTTVHKERCCPLCDCLCHNLTTSTGHQGGAVNPKAAYRVNTVLNMIVLDQNWKIEVFFWEISEENRSISSLYSVNCAITKHFISRGRRKNNSLLTENNLDLSKDCNNYRTIAFVFHASKILHIRI